jgi:hypothetical protein
MADPLRRIPVSAGETTPAANKAPKDLLWSGPRPGTDALAVDWYVAWEDAAGNIMAGAGSAVVQWYLVDFETDGDVNTIVAGAAETVIAHTIKRIGVPVGMRHWPIAESMTAPTVAAKVEVVTITGSADGVYSISVIGEMDPYEFTASSNTNDGIRDGLVALFIGHPSLTVTAGDAGEVVIAATVGGEDFEIDVDGPGDSMTEETTAPFVSGAVYLLIYAAPTIATTIADALDAAAVQDAAAAGAAEALADANLSYDLVKSATAEVINLKFGDPPPSEESIAAEVRPALLTFGASYGVDVDVTFAAAPAAGNRLAIYGFIATAGLTQFDLELRSGVGGANSQIGANPCKFTVGAGSSPSMTPGTQPLWHTANDQGIAILKSSTDTCHLQIWWKVVPNA